MVWTPPDPLQRADPGTVIRSASFPGPGGSRCFVLLHHSRTALDQDVATTSTLMVPAPQRAQAAQLPIIAYGHGTVGLGDEFAPSRLVAAEPDAPIIRELVSPFLEAGFAVVAADYEGLGTPDEHTYGIGQAEGRNVLDSVRAACNLGVDGLTLQSPVIALGHSQGGQAVLFAGELATTYAPEIRLLGVVAQAPGCELSTLWIELRITDTRGYVVMLASGVLAAYPHIAPREVATDAGMEVIRTIRDQSGEEILGALATADIDRLLPIDLSPMLRQILDENSPGARVPAMPVLVLHGTHDEQVPVTASRVMVGRYQALGADVQLVEHPTDHFGIIAASTGNLLAFATPLLAAG